MGRRARLRVGIRAFGRGAMRDRAGARVSSWYPLTIAHDRTTRGIAQKFFMPVYLRVCWVWKKVLEKVVDMPSQPVADCSHATSHRNRWHTNHHREGHTMSTRAERSAANRAAHAVKRAKLEEQWALAAAEKQADRKRRRENNRAAWWARYGMATPGIEQAEQTEQVEPSDHVTMPEVTEDSAVIAASATRSRGEAGHWFVEMNGVKCGTISWSETPLVYETPEGETMPCETEEQARGLAELYANDYAERSSAIAKFAPGMVFGNREIVSVAEKSVTVRRIGYVENAKRYKIKRDSERGDYISTNIGELYASRAA